MNNDIEIFKEHIKEFYSLPKKTKVVLFKNPENYRILFLEDINPTHKKIIYASKLKRRTCEKIAKIILPSLLISELLTMSLFIGIITLGIFMSFIIIGAYMTNIFSLYDEIFKLFEGNYAEIRKCDYLHIRI